MEAKEHTSVGRAVLLGIGITPALLLLYAVSLIPVSAAVNRAYRPGQVIPASLAAVYRPLGWAYEHTGFRRPLRGYGRFLSRL